MISGKEKRYPFAKSARVIIVITIKSKGRNKDDMVERNEEQEEEARQKKKLKMMNIAGNQRKN